MILDNLIGAGKVKPMIVVMPLGYGSPECWTGPVLADLRGLLCYSGKLTFVFTPPVFPKSYIPPFVSLESA